MKLLLKWVLSWEFILLGHVVVLVLVVLLLSGCTTYISHTVADTQFSARWSIQKTEVLD